MTAEIAILNKSAVALAADSAVTIGEKIYNTENKIFTISKYHPVGIMIYGNAMFMEVPWATIIKMYRVSLGRKAMRDIAQYAEDFLKYIIQKKFVTETQQRINIANVFFEYFRVAAARLRTEDESGLITYVNEQISLLKQLESWPCAEKIDPKDLVKKYDKEYLDSFNLTFGEVELSSKSKKILEKFAGLLLTKQTNSRSESGIVFSGFGDEEIFPTLIEYKIDGAIDGHLKVKKGKTFDIDRNKSDATIIPFAQREMVNRFMEGIDQDYQRYIESAFRTMILSYLDPVIDKLKSTIDAKEKDVIIQSIQETIGDFATKAREYRRKEFVDPILDTVASLPKEDLANMAEALVNLTSIKRRVSAEKETVGGPIDVALISKGDGFIWIKRKHYFNPELNPYFLSNYFRDMKTPGDRNEKKGKRKKQR
ncbi:hypothetical protein UZ36_04745 [Candidatus Nitromaritima sp. SCGC AAA799-C22]|nr:hypothetical protein UZ36_04745 [Candidatus Nitromaritima sp. SCGC AAA799-C22]